MKYKDLLIVMQNISLNLGNRTTKGQKKLYKIYEKLQPNLDAFQKLLEDVRLDHASVDAENNVIMNEKGEYKFKKDDLKKLKDALKELDEKEIEDFKPITVVNPAELEVYYFLEGFVTGVDFEKPEEVEI